LSFEPALLVAKLIFIPYVCKEFLCKFGIYIVFWLILNMFTIQTKIELKEGNPEAFREVFRLLYPRLKGYCGLFITNKNEVEDIIQESFLVLWEQRRAIDEYRRIESFLFVIVRNRCLN